MFLWSLSLPHISVFMAQYFLIPACYVNFFRLDFTQSKPVSLSDDTSLSLGNLCPLNFGPNLLTLRILDSSIGIIGLPQQKLISICTDNFSLFTAVVCIQHSVHLSFSVFISLSHTHSYTQPDTA